MANTRPDIRISGDGRHIGYPDGKDSVYPWRVCEVATGIEMLRSSDSDTADWVPLGGLLSKLGLELVEQRRGAVTMATPSYRDSEGRVFWGNDIVLDATGHTRGIRVEGIGWLLQNEAEKLLARLAAAVHAKGGDQCG